MFASANLQELSPTEVRQAMEAGRVMLIDVREPTEFAMERIHGAVNFPLSAFDPAALPDGDGRRLVFQCGSGRRSAQASVLCRRVGVRGDAHLTGGIAAWKRAGLPVATGPIRNAR